MKIAVCSYDANHNTKSIDQKLKDKLINAGMILDNYHPDIVISIGGDGTLLSAFHKYKERINDIKFLGIHTGHLGFYTDWRSENISELVDHLVNNDVSDISYPLVSANVTYAEGQKKDNFLALNEISIKKENKTLICDVYINGELFERFRGDGLCISTPTGSTGYNKSLGGAVISPTLDVFQLAEIASINNQVYRTLGASIILDKLTQVKISMLSPDSISFNSDQQLIFEKPISQVSFSLSDKRIHFLDYSKDSFISRVKNSFIGKIQ